MTKLKPIKIQGKEYVTVAERVRGFNEEYANGSIETDIEYHEELVRCRAKVTPDVDKPNRFFTGHSEENRLNGNVNKTSATENAETSAVGRALGLMGIGIIEGIASADEVNKAKAAETAMTTHVQNPTKKVCVGCSKEYEPKPGTERFSTKCIDCFKKGLKTKPKQVIDDEIPPLPNE